MGPGFGYMPGYMSWMTFVAVLFWSLVVALAFVVVLRLARTRSTWRTTAHDARRSALGDANHLEVWR
jgi:hypothetical protein